MITDIGDYVAKGCGRCARFAADDCATHLWAEGRRAPRVAAEVVLPGALIDALDDAPELAEVTTIRQIWLTDRRSSVRRDGKKMEGRRKKDRENIA